ncbi:MAG: PilZ domain-containing protein [bacterium]
MKEKRIFNRLPISSEVDYKVKGIFNTPTIAPGQNLSVAGIMLITDEVLEEGTILKMLIKITSTSKQILAEGEVTWQKKIENNQFETGVKLIQISDEDKTDLMECIKADEGRLGEYRKYIRCPLNNEIKYRLMDDSDVERSCLGTDISGTGLKMLLEKKIGIGSALSLFFRLSEESAPISAEGKIKWEEAQEDGSIEAGIEFTKIDAQDQENISQFVYSERSKLVQKT